MPNGGLKCDKQVQRDPGLHNNWYRLGSTHLVLQRHMANWSSAKYIDNYNGFLISNYTKPVTIPTKISNITEYTFFDLTLYLETGKNCTSFPYIAQYADGPVTCNLTHPAHLKDYEGVEWSMAFNDGYEVSLYSSYDCSGDPLVVAGPEFKHTSCHPLSVSPRSYSAKPLFNGDYDPSFAYGKKWPILRP